MDQRLPQALIHSFSKLESHVSCADKSADVSYVGCNLLVVMYVLKDCGNLVNCSVILILASLSIFRYRSSSSFEELTILNLT